MCKGEGTVSLAGVGSTDDAGVCAGCGDWVLVVGIGCWLWELGAGCGDCRWRSREAELVPEESSYRHRVHKWNMVLFFLSVHPDGAN